MKCKERCRRRITSVIILIILKILQTNSVCVSFLFFTVELWTLFQRNISLYHSVDKVDKPVKHGQLAVGERHVHVSAMNGQLGRLDMLKTTAYPLVESYRQAAVQRTPVHKWILFQSKKTRLKPRFREL